MQASVVATNKATMEALQGFAPRTLMVTPFVREPLSYLPCPAAMRATLTSILALAGVDEAGDRLA